MNGAPLAGRQIFVGFQESRNGPQRFSSTRGRGGGRGGASTGVRRGTVFADRSRPMKETVKDGFVECAPGSIAPKGPPSPEKLKTPERAISNQAKTCSSTPASAPSRLQVFTAVECAKNISHENVTLEMFSTMSPTEVLTVLNAGGNDLLSKLDITKQPSTVRLDHSPRSKKLSIITAAHKSILHLVSFGAITD